MSASNAGYWPLLPIAYVTNRASKPAEYTAPDYRQQISKKIKARLVKLPR